MLASSIFRTRSESERLITLSLFALLLLIVSFVVLVPTGRSYTTTWLNDEMALTAAAYRAYWGQIPSVDFSSVLGALTYYPAALGFALGIAPAAVLAFGQVLVTAFLLAAAVATTYPRLSLAPAVLMIFYVFLFTAVPTGIGGSAQEVTFGIFYDRYGWAALAIILLFYVEPHNPSSAIRWRDGIVLGLLLLYLFYCVITFAAIAIAFAIANAIVSRYNFGVSAIALGTLVAVVLLLSMTTDYNSRYIGDIVEHATSAPEYLSLVSKLTRAISGNETKMALGGLALLLLFLSGRRRFFDIAFAVGAIAVALVLTTQSGAPPRGVPVVIAVIACFAELAYRNEPERYWGPFSEWWRRHAATLSLLGLMLVFLSEPALRHSYVLYQYAKETYTRGEAAPSAEPRLAGFLVDPEPVNTLANALGADDAGRARLASLRSEVGNDIMDVISTPSYRATLEDGVALIKDAVRSDQTLVVFDMADPFSFTLGLRPTRYGFPLFWPGSNFRAQHPAPEAFFSNADYVMVPRIPYSQQHLDTVQEVYGPYLRDRFQPLKKSAAWELWMRKDATPATEAAAH